MTLIIGIKCKDGIVVASDSAATYGQPLGSSTVIQHTPKLDIVDNQIIMGTSGPVGLGQIFLEELRDKWPSIIGHEKLADATAQISAHLFSRLEPFIQRANSFGPLLGNNVLSSVLSSTIIAFPFNNGAVLLNLDHMMNPEVASETLPFQCIGSGQAHADPFLAFFKRVLWDDQCPESTGEGVLGALWTLNQVMRAYADKGVSGTADILTLKRVGENWQADRLLKEQMELHNEAIAEAEEIMKQHFRSQPD
jgi:hypothetical protein